MQGLQEIESGLRVQARDVCFFAEDPELEHEIGEPCRQAARSDLNEAAADIVSGKRTLADLIQVQPGLYVNCQVEVCATICRCSFLALANSVPKRSSGFTVPLEPVRPGRPTTRSAE